MDAGIAEQLERFDIVADAAAGGGVSFHEQAECAAARDGFEAQRAGPCERVDDAGAFEAGGPVGMGDYVEQGLARPVRGGACALPLRRADCSALQCASNDAHPCSV